MHSEKMHSENKGPGPSGASQPLDILDALFTHHPDLAHGDGTRDGVPNHIARSLADTAIARLVRTVPVRGATDPIPPSEHIEALCDALVSDHPADARVYLERLRSAGVSSDALYLTYIAGAARRLGERWVDDRATFFDVTIGVGRLHELVHELSPNFQGTNGAAHMDVRALVASVPGETHVLGIVMAADFLRRQGWHVDVELSADLADLQHTVDQRGYDVIGLSAATEFAVDALIEAVARLRAQSPNSLFVVGGHITELVPNIAEISGADLVSTDVVKDAHRMRRQIEHRSAREHAG